MKDIEDLSQRLTAALDRIGQGVSLLATADAADSALPEGALSAQEAETLQRELSAAKAHSETLQDQLDAARDAADSAEAPAAPSLDTAVVTDLEEQISALKAANAALIKSNQALTENAGDTASIDAALSAELVALRAARTAEAAEMKAVLAVVEAAAAGEESE